jgi:hypothetical protein
MIQCNLCNATGKVKRYASAIGEYEQTCDRCVGTGQLDNLNVVRHGDYYYVQQGPKGEGGPYFYEMYQERWSADTTIIGLKDYWGSSHSACIVDLNQLFIRHRDRCRLCQIERAYIEKYGRDPQEEMDEKARCNGLKYRLMITNTEPLYIYSANQAGNIMREMYPDETILETIEL